MQDAHELTKYIETTVNLSSLQRVVRSRNADLYNDILGSWRFSDSPMNFVEVVYHYLHEDQTIYCKFGKRMQFNGYRNPYSCKKPCECIIQKKQASMKKRYGVAHAMQSPKIQEKFKQTLTERYGSDSLYTSFREQRQATNLERYGSKTPLESPGVRAKALKTFKARYDYEHPMQLINCSDRDQYRKKARATYMKNHPELYDYDKIRGALEEGSIQQASVTLDLWPSHIKNVIISQGWEHLLPKKSSYEQLMCRFLDSCGIAYVQNTRSVIAPYELDFFIPEHALAIEINGLRWHGEHFSKKPKTYHRNKSDLCAEQGIHLIHIFEDEFNRHSKTIFSIIKTFCRIPKQKISARQCQVLDIDVDVARIFCEQHHLQGYATSSFRVGAFNNNRLVAVMTFKKKNTGMYELSRYVVNPDFSLIGVPERLFAYSKKQLHQLGCNTVITYSDNRFFTGDLYRRLGFTLLGETPLNYWYFQDATRRYHRLNFTKKKLIENGHNPNLTEWDIMRSLGYDRIWDCGNKKWELKLERTN